MEDNKKRKNVRGRVKFNVLDLIIIIAVVFIAVIAVMMTIPKIQNKAESGEKTRISYTVVFYDVDEAVFDKISNGQVVTDKENGISLGVVLGTPEAEPAYSYALTTDESGANSVIKQENAFGKRNITVTVEADAVYAEGKGYTVDGYRIAVGTEMDLRFPDYTNTGYCTGITVFND